MGFELLFALALMGGAATTPAQSALDGFDPNAGNQVITVAVQLDGKILIGGSFTNVAGVPRNRIARLNVDGTLDPGFNPNADSVINSILLQADGKILVGGSFTNIGGQTRIRIARLEATTGLADSFNPNANGPYVRCIALQSDGKIVVGGNFTSIGGQTRNRIARLDATTGLADAFNPDANSIVTAIAVQADGKIVASGFFNGANSIGGQTRNYIARLDPATGLADSFNPNANNSVHALAMQADGKIVVGGFFDGANSIGGQTRRNLARLDPTTGLADSFNPNPDGFGVGPIAVQPDGKLLVCGYFGNIGGQARGYMARLDATTGLADSFNPLPNNTVDAIALQADGKILVGGVFTALSPNVGPVVTRNHIARLETDGRLDQTANPIFGGSLYAYAISTQPDGKTLIGGRFPTVNGITRSNVARLNTDMTLDPVFNPNANEYVTAMAVQADGKILAGGYFHGANSIGGQTRNYIARLDPDTGAADSWDPNANDEVVTIALQPDGKVLIGGAFTFMGGPGGQFRCFIARLGPALEAFSPCAMGGGVSSITVQPDGRILTGGNFTGIGGQSRNRIGRLDPVTGLADSFDPNASNEVYAVALQMDGKVLIGGRFTSVQGIARNHIARVNPDGTLDLAFNPYAGGDVYSIAVQSDGKILVGGSFTNISGFTRNRIARLDPTTGAADGFDPNANQTVYAIALQEDGKVLAGGWFNNIGGQARNLFARLNNDTGAQQNLVVSPTGVTWTRGGSSPQLTRVTFESSTDKVNFTALGNGLPSGNNWTLAGLNLLTGTNIYIRARGYYRSGIYNGSESIAESVRNVYLAPLPPALNIQRSANTSVVLSWATNPPGFTLESNTNLTISLWSVVSPTPSVSGTNHVVTNTISGSARFYRLRK